MLDAMQPEVAGLVMTEFFNDLYVQPRAAAAVDGETR